MDQIRRAVAEAEMLGQRVSRIELTEREHRVIKPYIVGDRIANVKFTIVDNEPILTTGNVSVFPKKT